MTDLINRVDKWIEEDLNGVQEIVNKYSDVLKGVLPEKNVPYEAVIIDICVDYLSGSHGANNADWKAWSVVLIKKLFEADMLNKEADIPVIIDEFLEYKVNEYEKYCADTVSITDYDRDCHFMYRFFWKKSGKKIGSR